MKTTNTTKLWQISWPSPTGNRLSGENMTQLRTLTDLECSEQTSISSTVTTNKQRTHLYWPWMILLILPAKNMRLDTWLCYRAIKSLATVYLLVRVCLWWMKSIGMIEELWPMLRTKDHVDLVGPSQLLAQWRDVSFKEMEVFPTCLNRSWLTVLGVCMKTKAVTEDSWTMPSNIS